MPHPSLILALSGLLVLIDGVGLNEVRSADLVQEETGTVVIRQRQFHPEKTVFHQGHKARLVMRNQDSELHTFVPIGLFQRESFNVSGNGAPEFGPEGLKRVIIPPDGVMEIRFLPKTPGEYHYVCDMPGHQMNATILIE